MKEEKSERWNDRLWDVTRAKKRAPTKKKGETKIETWEIKGKRERDTDIRIKGKRDNDRDNKNKGKKRQRYRPTN